jgi:GH24 family phage-related lysozyme (muramidase)
VIPGARDMIKRNEGVRPRVYKDSLGIETIGVGFNLRRADAPARCKAHGLNYTALLSGAVTLTASQIDELLDEDLADCQASVRQILPSFEALPHTAQLVLLDMRFQLGAGGLKTFKHTLAAFDKRDWKQAAIGLRSSKAYKQTRLRWERNAKLLEALA